MWDGRSGILGAEGAGCGVMDLQREWGVWALNSQSLYSDTRPRLSAAFLEVTNRLQATFQDHPHGTLTDEQAELFERQGVLQPHMHLEIESICIFGTPGRNSYTLPIIAAAIIDHVRA